VDLSHPYLTDQLIAYIGNKRALLPFLHEVLSRIPVDPSRAAFLDPFAGSGAVSRLARMMGFRVDANDWEQYSWVINACHLGVGKSESRELFAAQGGLGSVLDRLNALPPPPTHKAYISANYAPRVTDQADWRTERLFYTHENALVIDAVRERIEDMYPGVPADGRALKEKTLLLAPLLYEAATHTNTSGVFKACHRGFGGHGGDALSRIMAGVRLEPPLLIDAAQASTVSRMDAAAFLRSRPAEICYLDPPYAVHQYGSNYFMLNSIALWDKPTVSAERDADGRFRRKAGIRDDWTGTRSLFCYKSTAAAAMQAVIDAADCRWLVVSYSNEGLIPLEELCDMLARQGELTVRTRGYVKYPGGRQSLSRTMHNLELALVVERRTASGRMGPAARGNVAAALREVRLAELLTCSFDPGSLTRRFRHDDGAILVETHDGEARLPMRHFWRFTPGAGGFRLDQAAYPDELIDRLSACVVRDARAEIAILLAIVPAVGDARERGRLLVEALRKLNTIAHRKYEVEFAEALASLRAFAAADPVFEGLREGLERAVRKAERRAAGSAEKKKGRGITPRPETLE
jgi:adenine-specific DNA-methyltransferase